MSERTTGVRIVGLVLMGFGLAMAAFGTLLLTTDVVSSLSGIGRQIAGIMLVLFAVVDVGLGFAIVKRSQSQ